jgi:hypothetical protein
MGTVSIPRRVNTQAPVGLFPHSHGCTVPTPLFIVTTHRWEQYPLPLWVNCPHQMLLKFKSPVTNHSRNSPRPVQFSPYITVGTVTTARLGTFTTTPWSEFSRPRWEQSPPPLVKVPTKQWVLSPPTGSYRSQSTMGKVSTYPVGTIPTSRVCTVPITPVGRFATPRLVLYSIPLGTGRNPIDYSAQPKLDTVRTPVMYSRDTPVRKLRTYAGGTVPSRRWVNSPPPGLYRPHTPCGYIAPPGVYRPH